MPDIRDPHPASLAGVVAANFQRREPAPVGGDELVAAAAQAVNDLGQIVSGYCASDPASLTEDRITAYALALIRLRECASAASLERLTRACDALAVTVSRLIEDRGSACAEKCAALKRFVVHANEMIEMAIGHSRQQAALRPAPTLETVGGDVAQPPLERCLG